jgi:NAD(P)-dependent dehydrogenase (short-subunit alcohol dehydrogenase family)
MTPTFTSQALSGQSALVTGSSRGIGEAIARQLAAMGAKILLAADDLAGLDAVASAIEADGGSAEVRVVDLTDRSSVSELADAARGVDILVNNAAPGQGRMMFSDTTDEDWDKQMNLILRTSVWLIRSLAPSMASRGRGCVVNISSAAVEDASPKVVPYAAAKAGLEVVTRAGALEFGPQGVRFNAVRPSFVSTERVADLANDAEFLASRRHKVPLGRLATAEDIANAVAWLCSEAASFVNGQTIDVDGGVTAGTWRPERSL